MEIEKLKTINLKLEDKVQRLEEAQKSFDELNTEHLQILEDQRKQIEERNGFLSRLTGLVQGYEQRKTKLLEEIGQAKEEREQLQQDIKSLLSEQKKNFASALAKKNDHVIKNDLFLYSNNNIIIKDSLGWLLCSKNKIVDAGDHSILIADVIESKVFKGSPLIFWNSDYKYIGE